MTTLTSVPSNSEFYKIDSSVTVISGSSELIYAFSSSHSTLKAFSFGDDPHFTSGQNYNNNVGMYVRIKVDDVRETSKLDLTKLEDQNSKYYIGFEFSTNYESSNLYIWSVILHGKTFYS